MPMMTRTLIAAMLPIMLAATAEARDQIRIVGSSTVFPFATAVAEQFGRSTDFPTPVVESTGSGGGIKLFCAGIGAGHPDIANASRRMKKSEFAQCQENGVAEITEVVIGYDGIVLANVQDANPFRLSRAQLWAALAAEGERPRTWADVDPALPQLRIEVLGPPPSSGTRDAFEELVMVEGCIMAGLAKDFCHGEGAEVREDGAFVDAGENDNLIVSKLVANPAALGIFGFSFLDQNSDKLQGSEIDGFAPEFDAIVDGDYPVARSMYFYIKNAHVAVIPGLREYAEEFMAPSATGEDGYLIDKGLIPLPEDLRIAVEDRVLDLVALTAEDLN